MIIIRAGNERERNMKRTGRGVKIVLVGSRNMKRTGRGVKIVLVVVGSDVDY